MPVGPDAENLQIDAPRLLDALFVRGASGFKVVGHAVRHMNPRRVDACRAKEMLLHETPVTLRVVGRQSHVLVQVERGDPGKIQALLVAKRNQAAVQANRGTAGSAPEHGIVAAERCEDDLRRPLADRVVIGKYFDKHKKRRAKTTRRRS